MIKCSIKRIRITSSKRISRKTKVKLKKTLQAMKTSTASLSGPPDSGKPAKSFESKR